MTSQSARDTAFIKRMKFFAKDDDIEGKFEHTWKERWGMNLNIHSKEIRLRIKKRIKKI